MKKLTFTLILLGFILGTQAQRKQIDSVKAILSRKINDTSRVNLMLDLAHFYYVRNPDSTIIIGQQAYELAGKYRLVKHQALALNTIATAYTTLGDYPKSTQLLYRSLRICEDIHDVPGVTRIHNNLGDGYMMQGAYRKALDQLLPANKTWIEFRSSHHVPLNRRDTRLGPILLLNIGESYLNLGRIDSADYYLRQGYKRAKPYDDLMSNIERDFGEIEIARGRKQEALEHLRTAIKISSSAGYAQMMSISYLSTAKLYHNNKQQDSAVYYAQKAFDAARSGKYEQDVLNAANVLYTYYDEDHNLPQAYKYFRLATAAKDSLYSQDRVKQLLSLDFEEKQRQQEIAAAQEQYRATVRMYALIGGLVVVLLLAIIFWRNSNQRKKANQLLQKQKEEIQATLGELKTTQNQLVQSAKMASLGELTAGIAHEIQNPLNFVNNFAEVNEEMLEELKAESTKPKAERNEQLQINLLNDIIENEKKIKHHGKRADFIVKGMLEHSRNSTGERQATNINVLANEFLKLSYHGLRAKDKNFNAELVTNFDDKLPKVNIVQQDIGRVLINLFGNAFYAVHQKARTARADYKPTVEVSTAQQNGSVMISVKDNGTGIPESIREKIMQPFFTTKPTGEGTGLGLSLSYDIVVTGHGGSIQVNSQAGEGSEFIVNIPLS